MRKKVMAANWKMYKGPKETKVFFRDFLPLVSGHKRDEIVVCPPYIDLYVAVEDTRGSNIAIGAQDLAGVYVERVGSDGSRIKSIFDGAAADDRAELLIPAGAGDAVIHEVQILGRGFVEVANGDVVGLRIPGTGARVADL